MKAGKTTKPPSSKSLKCPEVNAQPSAEPSVSAQPSIHPPSIHPSDQPSFQPTINQAFKLGFFRSRLRPGESVYSPGREYQLFMNTSGNLELNFCDGGVFDASSGACAATVQTKWQSSTSASDFYADFQGDGNFVVYDTGGGGVTATWASVTDPSNLPSGAYANQLFLPDPTSGCPCKDNLCIVVELIGGGNAYYYAVTDGAPFVELASCP